MDSFSVSDSTFSAKKTVETDIPQVSWLGPAELVWWRDETSIYHNLTCYVVGMLTHSHNVDRTKYWKRSNSSIIVTYVYTKCVHCGHTLVSPFNWAGFNLVKDLPCSGCGEPISDTLNYREEERRNERLKEEIQCKIARDREWNVNNLLAGKKGSILAFLMWVVVLAWGVFCGYVVIGVFWNFCDSESAPEFFHYINNFFK